ncbi:phenylalanine 4-monooxygenase [Sphingomicrobium astaxanthinifaciens]|uniref:phenylalanine 4-monooxygenase n=1 Tax=Sphingomicrobium astaxanthinifaciens TaxID=1227949 RepID=UPI001FCC3FEE|nr:phenylalanine 4-monooxygenase [Sphingomicrobium astaxanthinifaciens]MCJ7421040.1 phenylalanine 4-monooxygenase [Sphingomicrobium astaxanthinifaciens]
MFQSRIAPPAKTDWRAYLVTERWARYTLQDHATWDRLFERQLRAYRHDFVAPFLRGIVRLDLQRPGIPRLDTLSDRLEAQTGWRLVPVAGIVPDAAFFSMLADRRFPIGNFIRDGRQLDYLEEPDCFHDIFGHVPLLSHAPMAQAMQAMGHLGLAACAAGRGEEMSRLYWHTVEFGLAREDGALKLWGAGLASSFAEARHALEAALPRPRFALGAALATPYRSDRFQPLYFVSDSVEDSCARIAELTLEALASLGEGEAPGYAREDERMAQI